MTALALRYLLARRKQTLLMLMGVLFGTACFITLSGLLLGFKDYLVGQLVNNAAQVNIEPRADGAGVAGAPAWYRRLDADPRVEAYSPQLIESVVFSKGAADVPGLVVGCDPLRQVKVTTIADYVTQGAFAGLSTGRRVALGVELQKKLGVKLGGTVDLVSARGVRLPFTVAALFKTGIQAGDSLAYIPLGAARRLDGGGDRVNEIAVRLRDYRRAAAVADAWNGSDAGEDKVESWDQKNPDFTATFQAEDMVRFLSIGAVLLVAAFGIYNVLTMMVTQKRKDIAILRSMGYGVRDILWLFLAQGLMLGLAGVALGSLAGWGCGLYLRTLSFGGNPWGSGTGHLAVSLSPSIYAQACVLGLLATTLSSLLPAHAACALTPIDIIRAGAE